MPLYVAKNWLFVGRREIEPGETFESELPPGRNWEPIDDEAKARCEQRDRERAALYAKQAKIDQAPTAPEAIPIPADWLELRPEKVVNLARRLGASGKCNHTQAVAWIEKVLAARAEQAAQLQGAA